MPTRPWQRILADARAGSPEALGRLLDDFRPFLWIIARDAIDAPLRSKIGGSDLVQESLLNAVKQFDRFHGDSAEELQAWLRKILLRVVANRRRHFTTNRRQARREVSLDAADSWVRMRGELSDPGETPSQHAMSREDRRAVNLALEKLPPHYREVVRLRSEERLAFEEVALQIGRTPDGARMLWGRAIRKIQALLGESS
jgi:RNA polymerase sigma-70 factor (ECF subfamily)